MIFDSIAANRTVGATQTRPKLSSPRPAFIRSLMICSAILSLSACQPEKAPTIEAPPPVKKPVPAPVQYSSAPIKRAPTEMIRYAQTALKGLGYSIGQVDGLWGPRSAKAIRAFEAEQKIRSANGHLSELNLNRLEKAFGKTTDNFEKLPEKPQGISAKLDKSTPLAKSPQLIIVEREYKVFAKPNPYSATLANLAPGTGIYVVSLQEGWYEIESINRLKGYIVAD